MLDKKDNTEEQKKASEKAVNTPKTLDTSEEETKAVEAVENAVAEEAEKEIEKVQIQMLDYASMDLEKLVEELQKLLKNNPIQQIKTNVEAIKVAFNSKFGKLLSEKKADFLATGGNSIDFQFSSPIKLAYNKLLSEYKTKRDAYHKQIEKQLQENLEKRTTIIEALKDLIANANPSTMYNEYKKLQDQWKAIGPVPRSRYNDTWKIYHHHVERFYDLLHMSKDYRALDFKHNLEEKLKIIKQAEALAEQENVTEAFKELQELHRRWKEEIGPVGKEHREEVWQKFSAATKKIHDKRHEYFRSLKTVHQEIIDKKLAIITAISSYDTSLNKTHKDWQTSIKEIETLRKQYFDAGKLPYAKSEAVWQKFKEATKKFNAAKNGFYKEEKKDQSENLKKKLALVELAESLMNSEDWEETTNTMKRIQSDWKNIGHVPRKYSDEIWKRFKTACNFYFDKLHANKNKLTEAQQAVVIAKENYLNLLKSETFNSVNEVQEAIKKWQDLGRLPKNARNLDANFNKQIEGFLEKLNVDRQEIAMLKFKNVISSYLVQEDYRKLDNEQLFLRKKIDETVREMQQLENNLSFVSNATEDNPLVKNVRAEINKFKDQLDIWHTKLNYLKKLDY